MRWFLATVGLTTGVIFAFGDAVKWRSTPSLHWLAQAPVPLRWWGIAWVAYAVLILLPRTRPLGYATGAVLFAIFTVSLFATVHPSSPEPKNIIVLAAMLDCVAFHAFSVRTAWFAKLAT